MCRAACPQAAAGCSCDCNIPGASGTSTSTCRGGCLHPPVRLSRDCRCKINAAKPLRPSLRSATSPRCGEAFYPAGKQKMMQQGGGTLGVPLVYACRKVFFVPSLQRRNRRNYKLLDKNTVLHKFDSIPFASRAYLCYNV